MKPMRTFGKLVVIIVFIILGLVIAIKLGAFAAGKTDNELCLWTLEIGDSSRSLSLWSKLPFQASHANPLIPPNCRIQNKRIEYPDKDSVEDKQREIKRDLAEVIRECWAKTGAGTLEPFGGGPWNRKFTFIRENWAYCVLCSKITFDQDIQEDPDLKKIYNFMGYLGTEKMILYETTYLNYLTYEPADVTVHGPEMEEFNTIDTSKTYYLVWKYVSCGSLGVGIGSFNLQFFGDFCKKDSVKLRLLTSEDLREARCGDILT